MRTLLVAAACLAAAPSPGAPSGGQAVERAESIPLRRGYYVAADTPCAEASRATVMLFKGDGFNLTCETRSIERLSRSTFRLSETCTDHEGGADMESTQVYEIRGDSWFTIIGEHGPSWSARFCRQSEMPEPFSTNDISDITG